MTKLHISLAAIAALAATSTAFAQGQDKTTQSAPKFVCANMEKDSQDKAVLKSFVPADKDGRCAANQIVVKIEPAKASGK